MHMSIIQNDVTNDVGYSKNIWNTLSNIVTHIASYCFQSAYLRTLYFEIFLLFFVPLKHFHAQICYLKCCSLHLHAQVNVMYFMLTHAISIILKTLRNLNRHSFLWLLHFKIAELSFDLLILIILLNIYLNSCDTKLLKYRCQTSY